MLIANRSQRSCPLALQPAHIIRRRTFCDLWRKRETNKPFQFILHQFIIALIICHLPQIECLSCLCASSSVWPVCLLHITLSLGAIWFAWLTPKGESAKVERLAWLPTDWLVSDRRLRICLHYLMQIPLLMEYSITLMQLPRRTHSVLHVLYLLKGTTFVSVLAVGHKHTHTFLATLLHQTPGT